MPLKSFLSKNMGREPSPSHPARTAALPTVSDGFVCSGMSSWGLDKYEVPGKYEAGCIHSDA